MSDVTAVLIAAAISIGGTWAVREICVRRAWVASAVGDRLQHAPTPRFGGIAIFFAFALVCLLSGVWKEPRIAPLLFPASGVFVLGLADDIWQVSPRLKLAVQVALAVIPVSFGITIPLSPWPLVNSAVTIFWFVGLTNAFNLLDNMNGLCAGIVIVASIFRGLVALYQNDQVGLLLCLSLASATFGFLVFNFPKGLIFMGDGGALFLGFTLAGFAFTGTYTYLKNYLDLLIFPVLLMLVPICDTTFVTLVRIMCGRRVSQGGRDHLSHSLLALGLTTTRAVIVLWSITALCGVISLIATVYGTESAVMLLLVLVAALLATTASLARYQIGVSRAVDLLDRGGPIGIGMTLFADVLVASGALYAACLLGTSSDALATSFFIRAFVPVIAAKAVAMVVLRCYPRSSRMHLQRVLRLSLANLVGSIVLLGLVFRYLPQSTPWIAVIDFVVAALLIVALRSYHRAIEKQCLTPLSQGASHD